MLRIYTKRAMDPKRRFSKEIKITKKYLKKISPSSLEIVEMQIEKFLRFHLVLFRV